MLLWRIIIIGSMWGMRVSGGSAFSTNHFHFNQLKLVGENDHTITLTSCNNSFQDYNISDYENYLYTENTTSITGLYKDSYFYLFASKPFMLNVFGEGDFMDCTVVPVVSV